MSRKSALIMLCHGSRDPSWIAPFEAIRNQVARECPGVHVRIACLQFRSPSLAEAARVLHAEGVRCINVIPMFMSRGGHVARDLPGQIAELERALPETVFQLTPALGEMPNVRDAISRAIIDSVVPNRRGTDR